MNAGIMLARRRRQCLSRLAARYDELIIYRPLGNRY